MFWWRRYIYLYILLDGELVCGDGYEGTLCAWCSDGYVLSSHLSCSKCSDTWMSVCIVVIQIILPFFYVGINIYFKTNLNRKKWSFEYLIYIL